MSTTALPLSDAKQGALISKVPAVTLAFWLIKICATTLGETGGDALSMGEGKTDVMTAKYLLATLIFLGVFLVAVTAQVWAKRYHASFYWLVVVATTTAGTTMSDYLDRTCGLGYLKSSVILFCGVIAVLAAWRLVTGAIQFEKITLRKNEIFYWLAILVSNTLGTALGDYVADENEIGLGFQKGALIFAGLIAVVAAFYIFTKAPRAVLFWAAYVLTRPLGATLGDTLTKPLDDGGLDLGRLSSSLVLAGIMVAGIAWMSIQDRKKAQRLAAS